MKWPIHITRDELTSILKPWVMARYYAEIPPGAELIVQPYPMGVRPDGTEDFGISITWPGDLPEEL